MKSIKAVIRDSCLVIRDPKTWAGGTAVAQGRLALRLLAVLDVLSSTPARAKRRAPRPDGPLTHFASPRGEKYRQGTAVREKIVIHKKISLIGVTGPAGELLFKHTAAKRNDSLSNRRSVSTRIRNGKRKRGIRLHVMNSSEMETRAGRTRDPGGEMTSSSKHIRSAVAFIMLTASCSDFQAGTESTALSVPFVAPKGSYVTQQDRYHTFRIPGMIVSPDGSILLFAEGRRGEGSDPRRDENAPIDLVMRRSTDNGLSWEPPGGHRFRLSS